MDFEKLYGHAPVGICYFGADLRYVYVNDWLATLNGLPVQQHLGQKIGDILPNVAAAVEGELRRVLETGEPLLQAEVQLENAAHAGSERWYERSYYRTSRTTTPWWG